MTFVFSSLAKLKQNIRNTYFIVLRKAKLYHTCVKHTILLDLERTFNTFSLLFLWPLLRAKPLRCEFAWLRWWELQSDVPTSEAPSPAHAATGAATPADVTEASATPAPPPATEADDTEAPPATPAPDTEGAMDPASRAWTWSRISTLLKSFVAASPAEPKAAPSSHGLTEDQATGIPVRIIHEDYIVYMKDSRKRTVPITRITTIPRIK